MNKFVFVHISQLSLSVLYVYKAGSETYGS